MTRYLYKGLDFLIFSNIFIALCAVAQALVTYSLLNSTPNIFVLSFLFFSTLCTYNFSILMQRKAIKKRSRFKRIRWFYWHRKFCVVITFISAILLIPIFFALSNSSKILLIILGILSIGYSLPLFSKRKKKFGFRNIPGLKLFLIALVWATSCVTFPVLELNESMVSPIKLSDTFILTVKRFLFIAAITVPFDIRDLFQDKFNDLKTIPTTLGEKGAYLFCQFLLILYLGLLFIFNKGIDSNVIALTITIALAGWLIFKSSWKKNEYYYFLYLDGTMLLQYLLIALFSLFTSKM